MSVVVDLPPEIEARLVAQAAEQGLSLSAYLRLLLEGKIGVRQEGALSPAERAAAWRDSAKGLPHTPPLSDAAVSREGIYDTAG